jgi:uncharacterized protein YecA (UPF0149 family)
MEIETLADQTLAQKAELDRAASAAESDTIRHNPTVKSEPDRLSRGLRSCIEFETMAGQSLVQTAEVDLATMADTFESDTIRQNPTLKSGPSRNSRCACGSGLKYKRCCADQSDLYGQRNTAAAAVATAAAAPRDRAELVA